MSKAKRAEEPTQKGGGEQVKKKAASESKAPARKMLNFTIGFNPETQFRGENDFSEDDDELAKKEKKKRCLSVRRFKETWASQREGGNPEDEFFSAGQIFALIRKQLSAVEWIAKRDGKMS